MPGDAMSGSYTYRLKVASLSGNLFFEETKDLTFKRQGFSIMVQSDKAIYKPGQTSKA